MTMSRIGFAYGFLSCLLFVSAVRAVEIPAPEIRIPEIPMENDAKDDVEMPLDDPAFPVVNKTTDDSSLYVTEESNATERYESLLNVTAIGGKNDVTSSNWTEKTEKGNLNEINSRIVSSEKDVPLRERERHSCQRTCQEGFPMTCKYDFVIEHFSTMSKACFECPYNSSHCDAKYCIPGDGFKRPILTVNRRMPGPPIEVCHGDIIEVKVYNKLIDISTTIHWHGILQRETPFMDGVPFVSQCPIPPQGTFNYKFFADTPGTHIWHAHSAFQRGDGIYGALVVKVPENRNPHSALYDYDLPEHTFTVMDWEHEFSPDKFALHVHAGGDNKPSTLLINGKGRFQEFRKDQNVFYTPVETFTVKQGFRYRFRLINAGFLNCPIEMTVDNHNITVIATDGGDVQPVDAISLVSLAGERYDFIITANQQPGNYWIRFKGLLDCSPKKAFQVAILNYKTADTKASPPNVVTYETSSRPGLQVNKVNAPLGQENAILISQLSSVPVKYDDPTLKPVPDFKFYLAYDFYPLDNTNLQYAPAYGIYMFPEQERILTPQINHISMAFPSFALLTDPVRSQNMKFCNSTSVSLECRFKYCECTHVLQIPFGAVVEIILIDEGLPYDANHPFHLHGFKFRVLGSDRLGNSTTESTVRNLDKQGLLKRNFDNPPFKDTVTTPDGGYSILRFHATNPGYWIFHCHIDFHVEMGMALLFKVGDNYLFKNPPENFPECGDYDINHPAANDYKAHFMPEKLSDNRDYYMVQTSSATRFHFTSLILILFFIM